MIKTILFAIWITYTIALTIEYGKIVKKSEEMLHYSKILYDRFEEYVEMQNMITNSKGTLSKKEYEKLKKSYEELQNKLYEQFKINDKN